MPETAPPRRTARDLTSGPITRTLIAFALPTLASNVLQTLNGSVNAIWIGRFLGEGALAATVNANLVMFLLVSAVFGFGMAATVLIGQRVGARELDGARRVMGTISGLFVAGAILVSVVGWFTAPALLRLLATPEGVQPLALAYLRVLFLGLPGSFMLVLLMMGLRGFGDAVTPLWFMGLSVVIDMSLNPVLILGLGPAPRLGIAGSALANLIATYLSLAALLAAIYLRDLPIRLRGAEWRYLRPDPVLVRTLVTKGVPMGLQMIVMSVSALTMIGLVNRDGVVTTAAYGAINQLWSYVQMPAMAIGAAVSAMAAQNIGAGLWSRVDRITRAGIIANLAMTGALVLAIVLVDRQAVGLFLGADSQAVPIAARIHLIAGWGFILFGATLVLNATMRANGVVTAPLVIMLVGLFPVRFAIALLGRAQLGIDAVWWSFPAGSVAMLTLTALYFRRGRWREARMAAPLHAVEAEERALADAEACGREGPAG
ncbi:MATE family efflux transporter [Sphingomonas jatrophae]|uniref:Putative efflux protein, MATE family n=1 Tax=Sphingomonas jatrophae TaxID=1166337 RepID=A0A1I6JT57_9SPHN|nr:MATE family efflux transporter [Sphingomonas jatrophae]SFR82159.1 putative efflux protein, MATE family [Sphingomonas jatrophae]